MYIFYKIFLLQLFFVKIFTITTKPQIIHGRFTRNIKKFELLVPHKVNFNGDFLTYSLPNYFLHNYEMRRRKRDFSESDAVHYKLYFNNKDHHIELWPNNGLIAPDTISEYHYPGADKLIEARKMRKINPALCHYTGTVRDHESSSAALSLCDGLVGYVKTDDGTFFIEPAEHYGPNELGHHLHIIHMSDDPIMNENADDVIVKKKENQCYATSASDESDDEDFISDNDGNIDSSIYSSKISSPYVEGETPALKKADNAFLFEKPKKLFKKNCGSEKWEEGWSKAFKNYFKIGRKDECDIEQDEEDEKEDKMKENPVNMHKVSKKKVKNVEKNRKSRTASVHRYLEVLVVADKMFLDFHKDKDYENYILTTMNMVSDFFHDASTGNQMDVVVVRIIYLDQNIQTLDLSLSPNGAKSLKSFCKWQYEINPKSLDHPQHHDIAVLITRHDICADEAKNCDLLGLAYMASACTPTEACAINEDKGLILGIVIAHEVGHVMGCNHDGEQESGCPVKSDDSYYHLMSPYVSMSTSVWSTCSRKYMTELFENNLGECLNDEPQETTYKGVTMLAGAVYDADYQCSLLYPNSSHCPVSPDVFCTKLFCKISADKCRSNGEPPAEGTKCAANKWCYKKNCVMMGQRPEGISGGWGPWGDYGPCSRTCGGGVKISERDCNNPKPQNGGLYCIGERKRFQICNAKMCARGSASFRAKQCTDFDKVPRNGKRHTWKPYEPAGKTGENTCVLYCINEERVYSKLAPRAKDGTPCKRGTNNMCVSGSCRKVGCDWRLDSSSVADICGICNGDGTGCKIFNGTYKQVGNGYAKVITIPRGARNILIQELLPSENTIAIGSGDGKLYYLNGQMHEESDGEKKIGKNVAMYMHVEPNKEELLITGPLFQNINFYVVFYDTENVGYKYEYYIRNKNYRAKGGRNRNGKKQRGTNGTSVDENEMEYHWDYVEWTNCDYRCGGGETKAVPVCTSEQGEVSDDYCPADEKPETKTKVCNKEDCKVRWHIGEWGPCNGCEHRPGSQIRRVWCARESPRWEETDILTEEEKCNDADGVKPPVKQLCTGACTDICPKKERSIRSSFPPVFIRPPNLDFNAYRELYKKLDILYMEPEGVVVGVIQNCDSANLDDNDIECKKILSHKMDDNGDGDSGRDAVDVVGGGGGGTIIVRGMNGIRSPELQIQSGKTKYSPPSSPSKIVAIPPAPVFTENKSNYDDLGLQDEINELLTMETLGNDMNSLKDHTDFEKKIIHLGDDDSYGGGGGNSDSDDDFEFEEIPSEENLITDKQQRERKENIKKVNADDDDEDNDDFSHEVEYKISRSDKEIKDDSDDCCGKAYCTNAACNSETFSKHLPKTGNNKPLVKTTRIKSHNAINDMDNNLSNIKHENKLLVQDIKNLYPLFDGYVIKDKKRKLTNERKRNADGNTLCNKDKDVKDHLTIDHVPKDQVVVIDVPLKPPTGQNLSDEAYEKFGDKLGSTIDIEHEKVYTGDKAICILEKANGHNDNEKNMKTRKKSLSSSSSSRNYKRKNRFY